MYEKCRQFLRANFVCSRFEWSGDTSEMVFFTVAFLPEGFFSRIEIVTSGSGVRLDWEKRAARSGIFLPHALPTRRRGRLRHMPITSCATALAARRCLLKVHHTSMQRRHL